MIKVLGVHDAKHFAIGDFSFHEADGVIARDGNGLSFGDVNGFRIDICDEDTDLLSGCGLVNAGSEKKVMS